MEIFEYVAKNMTDKNGGFSAKEDADSEGEEVLITYGRLKS